MKRQIVIIFLVFSFYAAYTQYTFQYIFKDPLHQLPGNVIETSNGDLFFSIITEVAIDSNVSKISVGLSLS